MKLEKDTTISHYKILSKIGKGGMGEVYLAEDTKLDRKVALKILPPEFAIDADRMSRFVREAKSASTLNHPNIITIHEIGEFDGTHFISTEYIEGETLSKYSETKRLKFSSALDIAIQVTSALDEAHSAGIVHRDIKPDNVMVRVNGLVKILDFGIAKLSVPPAVAGGLNAAGSDDSGKPSATADGTDSEDATAIQSVTTPGMIIGTANYMSPEQAKGQEVDARTDIFSFGVVLYEMIAGHLPFEGETPMETIAAIINKEPKPLDNSEIPPEIERIIGKTLRKDRDERYQTTKGLLADLKEVKQELEFQDKLEKTVSPDKEEPKTQILSATTIEEPNQTTTNQAAPGKPTKKYFAIALAILLISVIGFFGYNYYQSTQPINSIAVLPFENKGSDADTEYLSDGLGESLIYRLSQLPNLKVSPTSSVFRYKGRETDPVTVGNELGVNAVLTGRIVQRGESLTISVELIDVRNNKLIWGEKYERKLSELLTTQRQIATEISQNLKLQLSGDEKGLTKPYTNSNEAYQLYLKGSFHFSKRTKEDILSSIDYFTQAVSLDPNFALAHARIGESYNTMPAYPFLSPKEAMPKAKAAILRALEIDPSLAEAHTAMGNYLAVYEWNWTEAEREFKRAIQLDPNKADPHQRFGQYVLIPMGRSDEAITELKLAVELEPLSFIARSSLSTAYLFARRDDEALNEAQKLYDLDSSHPLASWQLGHALIVTQKYMEAIAICEKVLNTNPTNQSILRFAGIAYAKSGRRQDAEAIIKKFENIAKTEYVMSSGIAKIYAALGDKEKAFAMLEKAYTENDWALHRIKVNPFMDPLRNDPRFKDLLKRVSFPE